MAGETDINTKYQKLATEYAKLRSQISVLKKGVLDEQDKSSVLSDQLNDRETQLRKQESETEGILFRNQQLTRRVNVLQEEIDTMNSKPKSKWKIGGGDSTGGHQDKDIHASRVINEELAAKITENARLHATLDDIEKQYETTIQTLQTRIQQLEKDKNQLGLDRKNHESETNDSIQHYAKENDELRNQIIVLRRDLGVRTKQIESLEVQVSVLVERERNLESVKYCDFTSQYEYINPDQVREQEQKERDLLALNTRLSECISQLSQAERDREHWKLEFQLATIKLNKNNTQTPDSEGDSEMNDSSILDSSITAIDHNQVKDAFENRISELISDKITADSKATAFYLECEAVNYKLEDLSSQLLEKENMYEDEAKLLQRKEEEWQTMQSNYEEQLSVISDHLAEMNTRLASQEDEIQLLRQTKMDTTDSKKNKGKKS